MRACVRACVRAFRGIHRENAIAHVRCSSQKSVMKKEQETQLNRTLLKLAASVRIDLMV